MKAYVFKLIMSVTNGLSWCPYQLISCDTEVKIRHAAHASTETKVNSTQFSRELYGLIYDVLRLDTWQETECPCMPLSLCLWRADAGSGHTCPDREAIETPQINPPDHQPPPPSLWSIKGHTWPPTPLESILIGWKCSQRPSRNNAQWSARGRGGRVGGRVCRHAWRGGGRNSLPLVPPSIQTQKSSSVTTSQEETGSLFFHLGDEGIWAWQLNDPTLKKKKKGSASRAQIAF